MRVFTFNIPGGMVLIIATTILIIISRVIVK